MIEQLSMPIDMHWSAEKGFRGTKLQWAQTFGKDKAAYKNLALGKLRTMTAEQRIIEYNRTILHMPQPTDIAVIQAAKEHYGIDCCL